jgi:hypothetical protein
VNVCDHVVVCCGGINVSVGKEWGDVSRVELGLQGFGEDVGGVVLGGYSPNPHEVVYVVFS